MLALLQPDGTLQILEIRLSATVEYPFNNMDDLNAHLLEQIDFIKKQLKKVGEE